MKKKGSFGGGPNEPTEWQESREWKYSIHIISRILHNRASWSPHLVLAFKK